MFVLETRAVRKSFGEGEAAVEALRGVDLGVQRGEMLAIMGRIAAYTGQRITWEMALNSQEDLSPPAYDWNIELAVPAVAMPGKTTFR